VASKCGSEWDNCVFFPHKKKFVENHWSSHDSAKDSAVSECKSWQESNSWLNSFFHVLMKTISRSKLEVVSVQNHNIFLPTTTVISMQVTDHCKWKLWAEGLILLHGTQLEHNAEVSDWNMLMMIAPPMMSPGNLLWRLCLVGRSIAMISTDDCKEVEYESQYFSVNLKTFSSRMTRNSWGWTLYPNPDLDGKSPKEII